MNKGKTLFVLKIIQLLSVLSVFAAEELSENLNEAQSEYFFVSLEFLKTGNAEEAISGYLKVLELDQEYAPAHYRLGSLYSADNQFDHAKKHFNAVMTITPQSEIGVKSRLEIESIDELLKTYDTPEAIRHFEYLQELYAVRSKSIEPEILQSELEQIIAQSPSYHEGYFLQAEFYLNRGMHEEALESANYGLGISPAERKEALSEIVDLISREGTFAEFINDASAHYLEGEHHLAAQAFEKAFLLFPDRFEAAVSAANSWFAAGDLQRALKLYEKIKDSADWENAIFAAKQIRVIKPVIKATEFQEAKVATLKGGPAYQRAIGEFSDGNNEQALKNIDLAITDLKTDPIYSKYYQLRGKIRAKVGAHNSAIEDFRRAIDINPSDIVSRIELSRYLIEKSQFSEALFFLNSTPEKSRTVDIVLTLGYLSFIMEDYKAAELNFREALSKAETNHQRDVAQSWLTQLADMQSSSDFALNSQSSKTNDSNVAPQSGESNKPESPADKKPIIDFSILDN